MTLLSREDVPVEPVLSAAEARDHPQVLERGVLAVGPDRLPRLAFPARFDGERPVAGGAVPDLGAQTRPLLQEVGAADLAGASAALAGASGASQAVGEAALLLRPPFITRSATPP